MSPLWYPNSWEASFAVGDSVTPLETTFPITDTVGTGAMAQVVTISGRTDFQCIGCDDPAVRWVESSLKAPEKPIVAEPV
jgi:hypothetical protein